jgi:oxygen-dependent protoporphyrinogen oxidase
MGERGRAIVVGGGVAGLSWALDAVDAGFDVLLLERDPRLGGVVRSETLGPVQVDVGAESFALTRPDVLGLADRLGLSDDVVRPSVAQAHVMRGGRLMPLPPGLLGIPADADDIAALLGADAATEARSRDAAPVSEDAPTTIGRLVRERLGDTVADVLVDPVLAGVHATRADDAELASVAPSLHAAMRRHGGLMPAVRALRGPLGPAGSPVATIVGGMGRLVARLAAVLAERGADVRLGTEVEGLHHDGAASDGAWRVHTNEGELGADVLCLAVPASVAAGLLRTTTGLGNGLGPATELATSLTALPTTHDVLLVTLLIEDAALTRAGAPVGSGVLVADDTVQAKAMTHASAKWGWLAEQLPKDHHVLRLSYGGTHDAGTSDPDDLVTTARADLLRLLDGAAVAATVRASLVTRWHGALTRPIVGRAQHLAEIDELLALVPRLALTGSAVAGNGLAGVVGRSAREAARTL